MNRLSICVTFLTLLSSTPIYAEFTDRAVMASRLFNIPLEYIDRDDQGANYNYNPWGSSWTEKDGLCLGYDGGHSGIDFQTKDVAGPATNDRYFYAVTQGQVVAAGEDDYNTISVYDSDRDISVLYLHARSVNVQVGDQVYVGDILGIQGDEGAEGAEHVHMEVREGEKSGPACGATGSRPPEQDIIDDLQMDLLVNTSIGLDYVTQVDWRFYNIMIQPTDSPILIEAYQIDNSVDLYIQEDARPSSLAYMCASLNGDNNREGCVITADSEETRHFVIGVRGVQPGAVPIPLRCG